MRRGLCKVLGVGAAVAVSVGVAASPAAAEGKTGGAKSCSSPRVVTVASRTQGATTVEQEKSGTVWHREYTGSTGVWATHYTAFGRTSISNWAVVANGQVDRAETYVTCLT
jgi:hypothetical protein